MTVKENIAFDEGFDLFREGKPCPPHDGTTITNFKIAGWKSAFDSISKDEENLLTLDNLLVKLSNAVSTAISYNKYPHEDPRVISFLNDVIKLNANISSKP